MSYESRLARIELMADFKGEEESGLEATRGHSVERAKVAWELMQEEPGIFVSGDGGVSFEWHKDGKMLVIEMFGDDAPDKMHGDVWVLGG